MQRDGDGAQAAGAAGQRGASLAGSVIGQADSRLRGRASRRALATWSDMLDQNVTGVAASPVAAPAASCSQPLARPAGRQRGLFLERACVRAWLPAGRRHLR